MATISEVVYTKDGADAAILNATAGLTTGTTSTTSIVDNGDGTSTVTQAGDIVDNGDGTGTVTPLVGGSATVTNGTGGTFTVAANGVAAQSYNKATLDTKFTATATTTALAAKADYPAGGTDGQALVKSGTSTAWTSIGAGGTVPDATATTKGLIQLAGDLTGSAAVPVLKGILGSAVTVGSATQIPVLSINTKGLVTAVSTVTAAGGGGGPGNPTTQSATGTAYTLALTDAGNVVEQNSTSVLTITIPPNSAVAFPIGTTIEFNLYGTGSLVLAGGTGVSLRSPAGLRIVSRYGSAAIRKRATDEWIVSGLTVV